MAISKAQLKSGVNEILKGADLQSITAKKVRLQLEAKFDADLSERKKEIDDIVMEIVNAEKQSSKSEDDENDNSEEEGSSSEPEEDDDDYSPRGKGKDKKKRRGAEEEEDDDDDDYKPFGKRGKGGKSKPAPPAKKGKTGKKASSEDESEDDKDEDEEDDDGEGDGRKRAAKKKAPPKKKGDAGSSAGAPAKKKNAGYTREYTLSPELAEVVGAKQMPRHEVVKKIWDIVKTKNLRDPKDKRYTICDDQLLSVFGVKRFQTFAMMKYLKNHFIDPQ